MKCHGFIFCTLLAGTMFSAAAADTDAISGIVHDETGKTITNASISLTNINGGIVAGNTTTGSAGDYHFADLAAGDYRVDASSNGYLQSRSPVVHVLSTGTAVEVDLTLNHGSANQTSAPLQFQASGLHGLIDPGGYSASANADAASGLVRGIADMKRTDVNLGAAMPRNLPCALQPQLRKNLDTHPDQAEANRRLGEFYVEHDQPVQAMPLLRRALQIDSRDPGATRALAVAEMQTGDFDDARTLLTQFSTQHDDAATHQLLAKADEGSGNFQQAAEQYRIADREEPNEQSVLGIGYELLLAGSAADADSVFQAGQVKYSTSISLSIGTGVTQFLLGHPADSVQSFLGAIEVDMSDPRAYPFLAAASGISDVESVRVRDAFKKYLERFPDRAEANYNYALILLREGTPSTSTPQRDTNRVEALLKRALQLDPTMASAHLQLADLYSERNNLQAAIPEYEAAIRLAPEMSEAHYRLALACKRAGRSEESAREMQIFQQSKANATTRSGSADINLAQFISVMSASEKREDREDRCVATSR